VFVGFRWPLARNCLHGANEACDVLYAYSAWLAGFEIPRPLEITSGFRHLITNDYMTEGGFKGGVGIYPTRNFVHGDCGRVWSWTS